MTPTSEVCNFETPLRCRYLLDVPDDAAHPLLVLALHGYGSNPEAMLRLTVPLVGPGNIVAAIQAPFQHYLGDKPGSAEIGYNWGVRIHHEDAINLHHAMLRAVLNDLRARFDIPAQRCALTGFSQPVGLNYRFVGTHPGEVGGVIALCGGVPRDWEEDKYQRVTTPILHISRNQDEYFPVDTVLKFEDRLRVHAADVEFHLMPGAHRFPSKASAIVQPWLNRVFSR